MKNRDTLIQYLRMKTDEGDWHGVADAAMDLREIEAEEKGRKSALRPQADRKCEHPANLRWTDSNTGYLTCTCGHIYVDGAWVEGTTLRAAVQ